MSSYQRLSSGSGYVRDNGQPLRNERVVFPYGRQSRTYVVHHYNGFGTGFMFGYLSGYYPWYWHTPFHPAYYYSRPYYVHHGTEDTWDVYPPTFSWWSVFKGVMWLALLAIVIAFVVSRLRGKRRHAHRRLARSSF